jgi:4-amino-4-deoxy-L-arabinose transferase-like glycosyltransferase
MNDGPTLSQRWWFIPAIIALIYFALHMATSTQYGYFRDALYYLSCARHMDWGYVDHPPLIVAIAWIALHVTGISLPALLIWPVLAGCARILLIAAFARELGAQRFGIALAAVLGVTPGVWWAIDHQFAMNAFEPLLWLGSAFVLLRLIKTEKPRLWVAFGAIAGIGMETKYSMAVFGFALLAGLLLTPQRKLLFTPWLLAGVISDFPSQFRVECGASLAVFRANAQYPDDRPRYYPDTSPVHRATDPADVPGEPAVLASWPALLFFRA